MSIQGDEFLKATETGDLARMKRLLSGTDAVDVNHCDAAGFTALHLAAYEPDLSGEMKGQKCQNYSKGAQIARLLMEYKPDLEKRNGYQRTPLGSACIYVCNSRGPSPSFPHDVVEILLEHGADVNARDHAGDTPLHYVCNAWNRNLQAHDKHLIRLLLDHGADVNVRNKVGCVPLVLLCNTCLDPEFIELLLDHGADIRMKDGQEKNAFDYVSALPLNNPFREELLDLFREYAPEAVMEAYCAQGPGGV